jgi:N-acetylneuraminate synthase/N,N'-diacetyllegionaminate synthase
MKRGKGFLDNRNNPYFVAEIGSNHCGDLKHAVGLIKKIAEAGADAVKFQLFSAERLYSRRTPIFPGEKKSPFAVAKSIELPIAWLRKISAVAAENGIDFLCTPFSCADVDSLENIGIKAYKVGSSEINDVILIKHIAMTKKPIFLSTGMASLADIELALETIQTFGPCEVVLLQCTALYPTPYDEVNLLSMNGMKQTFGCEVGFSDHTLGIHIPLAAVALGAKIIEKHVTMDRSLKGPDHFFALLPNEFGDMVSRAREITAAMGSSRKIITKGERDKRHLSQRSIITKRKISRGEIFCAEDLTTKRPGYGLPPALLKNIIGHRASRDIPEDEVLRWEDVLL